MKKYFVIVAAMFLLANMSCGSGGSSDGDNSGENNTRTLASIAITPSNPRITNGTTQQFTATGTYSDSTRQDITSSVIWSSSNTGLATISNTGLATLIAVGKTSITATLGSVSGNTTLTVTCEAEGLYRGITSTNKTIAGVILDDCTCYVLYSVANNPDIVAGVVQGNGTANSGIFTSSNAKDFAMGEGVEPVTIMGTYIPKHSFDGTAYYNNGTSPTFTSTYDSDYEKTPMDHSLLGI